MLPSRKCLAPLRLLLLIPYGNKQAFSFQVIFFSIRPLQSRSCLYGNAKYSDQTPSSSIFGTLE